VIVDSAETTARKVAEQVKGNASKVPGEHLFLVTDAEERFQKIAGEFLEQQVDNLQLIKLTDE
jgi:hypothetical protein